MFSLSSFRSVACAALCAVATGIVAGANATPMPNPAPFLLFDDTEEELVTPTAKMNAQFVNNSLGADIGFYFAGDPGTTIPIFLGTDPASIDPTVAAVAVIDFSAGQIIDSRTNTLVRTFTPQAGKQIGFYGQVMLGPLLRTVYSEPALNGPPTTGEDLVGIFPFMLDTSIDFVGFFGPPIFRPGELLGGAGVQFPTAAAPEPATLALLALGLAGLARRSPVRVKSA